MKVRITQSSLGVRIYRGEDKERRMINFSTLLTYYVVDEVHHFRK
jgi:hypothetical protein